MQDIMTIGGSTASGAAAGAPFGVPGMVIGGTIGFFSGLFSVGAKNEADRLAQLQIQREQMSVGMQGEARELTLALNRMAVDRQRKAFSQQAMLSTESVRAGEAITGLIGSSIARSAQSSLLHQRASALQFSYQTERMGELISQKLQDAADAAAGLSDPPEPEKPTYTKEKHETYEPPKTSQQTGVVKEQHEYVPPPTTSPGTGWQK